MSDTVSFRYTGTKDDYNKFKASTNGNGKTVEEVFSKFIDQELTIINHGSNQILKTASRYEDELRDRILQDDLSKVIVLGSYHVIIDNIKFIQTVKHELADRVKGAVYKALWLFWVRRWQTAKGRDVNQAEVYYCEKDLVKFNESIKKVKVTFTCDLMTVTLSDLRERDLGKVIQFDCIIIGPTPKKLDLETGKYIQKVLIQELETLAKNNNPVMIKAILHGDDTNNIASGQTKRFIGIYKTMEPLNGAKIEPEKTLLIDTINISDLKEKAEIELSKQELQTAREAVLHNEDKYLNDILESFCPKIYGRKLEKESLILAMLGGSESKDNDIDYRKDSHLMLISDSDAGKSEMLKFLNQVAPKSSLVDGSNATGVGLLFALDEYDGMKILRKGAMLLNNNGLLIVDEYDKMAKVEQKKLNQSMEQQHASYNKAGHVGEGECKTTVITACNPVNEKWRVGEIIDNIPCDPSGVTRFDNIIRVQKETSENQLRAKMNHIQKGKRGLLPKTFDKQFLKGLFIFQKKQNPQFTEDADVLLLDKFIEYQMIEQVDGSIPIGTRQMEGIARICQAYCKLTFRSEVDTYVVEKIILFYQKCQATLGMNVEKGISQMDLRGHSTNKDEYFEDIFKKLSLSNKDNKVYIHELAMELQENNRFFKTNNSVTRYLESRKVTGWLFEPQVGVFQRQ